jgi:FKBP-type peptidyl-prolyl cis-trans isomerase
MKKFIAIIALGAFLVACQPPQKTDKPKEITKQSLKTEADKLNYTVGLDIGKSLKRNGLDYNQAVFSKGLSDGYTEVEEALLNEEEQTTVKQEHSKAIREKRNKEKKELAAKNKAEGEKFLAENKGKEGVLTTESGLQYKIIKEGNGPSPQATDQVSVHYKGTLIDGTEFDSSYKRNKPANFAANRVIRGWSEALQLMPVGSTWQLVIPSDLAYGPRGSGQKIGPDAVLIFEVELLEIPPKKDSKKLAKGMVKGNMKDLQQKILKMNPTPKKTN